MVRTAGLSSLLMVIGAVSGLAAEPAAPVAGTLEVSYLVSSTVDGSRFTAVWLENEAGELVKTLFVSSELAQGAFTVEGEICPDWIKKSNWEKATQAEVDAVSGPTPVVGAQTLSFDLDKLGIAPGVYHFFMQVHIHDDYNILFKGKIPVGREPAEAQTEVLYSPSKYKAAEDLVRDVRARFTPAAGTAPDRK